MLSCYKNVAMVRAAPLGSALFLRAFQGNNIYLYSKIIVSGVGINRRNFSSSLIRTQKKNNSEEIVKQTQVNNKKNLAALTPASITKSYLLSQANNKFSRFLIHLKWPLKRNNKPFSMDDISAFASWVVFGNLLWILLGTTTFVLSGMYLLHLVNDVWDLFDKDKTNKDEADKSFVSNLASRILSQGLGVKVQFKKGSLLPELHDGMLRFKDIDVSSEVEGTEEVSETPIQFMAHVEHMNISLSFGKWYEGKGLIDELELYGMNGKIYQKPENTSNKPKHETPKLTATPYNRYHIHQDFVDEEDEIFEERANGLLDPNYSFSHFKIHDSYFEIYNNSINQKQSVPPMKVTIFNCDLPELNGNKLLIDFFNANNVAGAINGSMFTIHKHQKFNDTDENKMVRFKLDGIDMGKISRRNAALKFNWIMNGRAEIIADILLPQLNVETQFDLSKEYKKISYIFSEALNELIQDEPSQSASDKDVAPTPGDDKKLLTSALAAVYDTFSLERETLNNINNEYVVVNFKLKLYDLSASLPQQLPTASSTSSPYLSLHNLRMLIAFINNYFDSDRKPPLIIKTTVIEKFSNLYNATNLSQTNILDLIVSDIYEDLLKMVEVDEKRLIQERQNMWSHTIASQLLLLGLGVLA